jgi:iron complex outermembrane receptor protein
LEVERADVGGLDTPLARAPQSINVLSADLLAATTTSSLSSAIKLDASLADSYNTTGYIESMSVRGLLLNQNNNFQRNGLASSNYIPVAWENKERVEVLKGVAGLQSGVSAPGGLVNFVTKVPMQEAFTSVNLGADARGGTKAHVDSNFAVGGIGVRINAAAEGLRPAAEQADGNRQFFSVALARALSADTSLSAELEYHRKQQPSVPGVGLLDANGDGMGDTLPARIDPRLNLNNQSWSQPFESESTVAQLVLNQRLNSEWHARAAVGVQRSRINDRLAFPDGCSAAPTYVYPGLCANGDVDLYDYRSESEERSIAAWDLRLRGTTQALGLTHRIAVGLSGRVAQEDLAPLQAYNWVGTTNIYAPVSLAGDPALSVPNTNTRERAVDGYFSLTSDWGAQMQSFVGARISTLNRSSAHSDGSDAVALTQTVTTPWAGLSWSPTSDTSVYVSWGQGVELEAVPNRPAQFANYGEALAALRSEQTELGAKWQVSRRMLLTAAIFSIDKPFADDIAMAGGLVQRVAGAKQACHRGIEFAANGQVDSQLSLHASATVLDAQWTQAQDSALVGHTVTNVPRNKASAFADYKLQSLPGFAWNTLLTYESGKTALPNGSVTLPAAWQLDGGLRYQAKWSGVPVMWRVQVENLTDRSYWREAPTTSWGGVYLFPSTPRTLRTSVSFDF